MADTLTYKELARQMRAHADETAAVPVKATVRPASTARLVLIYPVGEGVGRCVPLDRDAVTIGRDATCGVVAPGNSASRFHARIEQKNESCYQVTDLDSSNGTFVNNVRVKTQDLRDGDYLQLGDCVYRFLAAGNVEADYHDQLHRMATLDPLTGVHNRRALEDFLDRELARTVRHSRPLAVLLLDVDRFKQVNDAIGHQGGDHALRSLAALFRCVIRAEDLVARYGGEEFAVVLPETDRAAAVVCAERIREAVAALTLEHGRQRFRVTVTIGVAVVESGSPISAADLLLWADQQLYDGKQAGRNRVMV